MTKDGKSPTERTPFRAAPRGVDLFHDLQVDLPSFEPRTIFDVGANVGQSAAEYVRRYPEATVYAFEPIASTFRVLDAEYRDNPLVRCFQIALGGKVGEAQMAVIGATGAGSRIVPFDVAATQPTEGVRVTTLDEFCTANNVDRIDLLKIDAEGHDLEVLRGAESLIRSRKIDLIQVEAGMNPTNERHVPFARLVEFLEARNYFLFALYEQFPDFYFTGRPMLRRTNPVFISAEAGEAHRQPPGREIGWKRWIQKPSNLRGA